MVGPGHPQQHVRDGQHVPSSCRTDQVVRGRVSDPHLFNADPDPAFFLIADPDPDPGFDDLKLKKI
jgi:hypothetical protein